MTAKEDTKNIKIDCEYDTTANYCIAELLKACQRDIKPDLIRLINDADVDMLLSQTMEVIVGCNYYDTICKLLFKCQKDKSK